MTVVVIRKKDGFKTTVKGYSKQFKLYICKTGIKAKINGCSTNIFLKNCLILLIFLLHKI